MKHYKSYAIIRDLGFYDNSPQFELLSLHGVNPELPLVDVPTRLIHGQYSECVAAYEVIQTDVCPTDWMSWPGKMYETACAFKPDQEEFDYLHESAIACGLVAVDNCGDMILCKEIA